MLAHVPKFYCRQCLTVPKKRLRPFQMPVCVYHTQDCLQAPVLMSLKINCPVIILSWFLVTLRNSPALLAERLLGKARSLPLSMTGLPVPLDLLLVQSLITPVITLEDMPRAGSGPVSGCEEPCRGYVVSIHSPRVLAPTPAGSLYILPVSSANYGSPTLIWTSPGKCQEL